MAQAGFSSAPVMAVSYSSRNEKVTICVLLNAVGKKRHLKLRSLIPVSLAQAFGCNQVVEFILQRT